MSLDDARLKKLRFRAWHRGFVEADLILGPYADTHVGAMTAAQLDVFEALLEQADHDLYGWIVGQAPTPAEFQGEVMEQIQAFRFSARTARLDGRGA
jgi:antitoxin CptB